MKRIQLGVIGLGLAWERLHGPAFKRLEAQYEITALCDIDLNKARSVARELDIPDSCVYNDYHAMLANASLDAVDCMVPIAENFDVAKAVITAGKHIIAEKPFSATKEGASELMKLSEKHNVRVLVAENYRYEEENILIKNLIEERKIGNVVYFIDNNVTEFQKDMLDDTFAATEWRQHPTFKGGVFLDSAIHHIARHRFLFGNVQTLYATGRPSDIDFSPYSCLNALLVFEHHITGHYAFFPISKETQAPLVGLRIFGTHGEIYLEDKNCGFVNVSLKEGSSEAIPYKPNEGYYNELLNFYQALTSPDKVHIVSTPEKELGDIQVIMDILASAEKNRSLKSSNKTIVKAKK